MLKAMEKQARKGNVRAFEVIRDTIGEKPVDKKEIEADVKINNLEEMI